MCWACNCGKLFASGAVLPSRRGFLRTATRLGAATALSGFDSLSAGAQPDKKPPPDDLPIRGPNEADLVFRNGPVFTANPKQPWAKAVAVRDGAITYVGEAGATVDYIGASTRVIELDGKLMLPGFVEGQIHPILGAALTQGIDLQYGTREEVLQALTAWRDKAGTVDVVRGYGWHYGAFGPEGPQKADLDALWPDTPVVLLSIDTHAAWANSAALKLAGIVRGVPDPVPGFSFYPREARTGDPTGLIVEMPAVIQILKAAAPFAPTAVKAALEEWLPKAAAEGITSLFDAGIEILSDKEGLVLYETIEKAKRLPCRIVTCHYHYSSEEDPLPAVRRLRDRARTDLVRAGVLKLILDGVESEYVAAMLAPYSDRPAAQGVTVLNAGLIRDTVMRADAEGFDVHFHTIGDRAVRLALDSIEGAVRRNRARERRHIISHLSLISDDDVQRFADLGVTALFAAQGAVPDSYWEKVTTVRWGRERGNSTYRMASLLRAGAAVSFGTAWPAAPHRSTFRPLDAIEVAVTRRQIGHPDQSPLEPADEAITVEQAVIANTLATARQLRLDDKVGSIAIGKRADLVVLDRDIFKAPPQEIHAAKVTMTVMNGMIRHETSASLTLLPLPVKGMPSAKPQ